MHSGGKRAREPSFTISADARSTSAGSVFSPLFLRLSQKLSKAQGFDLVESLQCAIQEHSPAYETQQSQHSSTDLSCTCKVASVLMQTCISCSATFLGFLPHYLSSLAVSGRPAQASWKLLLLEPNEHPRSDCRCPYKAPSANSSMKQYRLLVSGPASWPSASKHGDLP